jgi:Domain of unknown function (DUF4214)
LPPASAPDIDRILEAIRAEARARGSKSWAGGFSTDLPNDPGGPGASHGLQQLPARHVADYLALPLDAFIAGAYRNTLGREPDAAGAAYYQRMMLRGRFTRIEVLGRLAFSPEARRRGNRIPGIVPALAIALAYRIPLLGPAAAFLAHAARLPAHWQDRSAIEATALASGSWMKR